MRKITKLMLCLLTSCLIVGTQIKKAEAFFLMPPMPWDIEVDIPGDAGKVLSFVQTKYRELQTIKSQINTKKLELIKGFAAMADVSGDTPETEAGGSKKTPGKGKIAANSDLGIAEGELDEKKYYDAYYKLFFTYPAKEGDGKEQIKIGTGKDQITADYPVLQTAYRHKSVEYRQDIIMDTYLTGRMTEDFLTAVEKTLDRLDKCQKGEKKGEECVFFGIQMVEVQSNEEAPTSEENADNGGQLGAATNAYIVSTVYDRVLRIVEDLVATEAIYRAAKQIELGDPIMANSQSSADDYINNTFRFAYSETISHVSAKSLLNQYTRSDSCKSGSKDPDCPAINEDLAEMQELENTEILELLQPIEDALDRAVTMHNLKNQMPEYKAQYRRYLKAKEIHEKTLKVLAQSDSCVKNFLERHGDSSTNWNEKWGDNSSAPNNYEARTGISRELIESYQQNTTDVIIGTSSKCQGYYDDESSCPNGYVWNKDENCKYENDEGTVVEDAGMHPCVLATVEFDTDDASDIKDGSSDDSDYLAGDTSADDIELENRKKAEKTWQIGANKIMELTKGGKLQFKPWNDQQSLQEEYLRNKYRNIRMIIKSVDKGINSYKIASTLAGNRSDTDEPAEAAIKAIIKCASLGESIRQAHLEFCSDYSQKSENQEKGQYEKTESISWKETGTNGKKITKTSEKKLSCTITADYTTGVITGKKDEFTGEKDKTKVTTRSWKQVVSVNEDCSFKTNRSWTGFNTTETTTCPGTWNLTTDFLVKNYFPAVLGECKTDGAEALYETAETKGRRIALNYFNNVIETRKNTDKEIKAFITKYNDKLKENKAKLQSLKKDIMSYNKDIDTATKAKNKASRQLTRSERRMASIDAEITQLNESQRYDLDEDKCAASMHKEDLENEKSCIKEKKLKTAQRSCIKECKESQCDTKTQFSCDNYLISLSEIKDDEKDSSKYVLISEAKSEKEKQEKIIQAQKSLRDNIKEEIKELEKTMAQNAEDFADPNGSSKTSYITLATEKHEEVETANDEFENFLETASGSDQPNQMKNSKEKECYKRTLGICTHRGPERYKSDNLETTMNKILYRGKGTKDAVKDEIKNKWFKNSALNNIADKLSKLGVPERFVADSTLTSVGINSGPQSIAELVKSLRDTIVDIASGEIVDYIQQGDEIIKDEIDAAVDEIETTSKKLGLCSTCTITDEQKTNITTDKAYYNYPDGKDDTQENEGIVNITDNHVTLIKALLKPTPKNADTLKESGLSLAEIFGIPVDENGEPDITTDEEYFVGLPARGEIYRGKSKDENAGRDYKAPKGPMLNLPPMREVFYYSALDYDDTPKKNGRPAIPYLLNYKYADDNNQNIEYMPEIWRYLLARPNLRSDGKYQQTFVERSYGGTKLKNLLDNLDNPNIAGAKTSHYRAIIGRSGVYPCKLGNQYIDMTGGDNIKDMSFKTRAALPSGVREVTCQEVALGTTPCSKAISGRKGLCHLLADHGLKDVTDNQNSLKTTSDPMYEKYSELGQFIGGDLKYRPLQKNIHEYLLNSKNNQNSIERQKAELASFKRNVMGTFLEAVNAEHTAKKNLDSIEEDIKQSLNSLCKLIHDSGNTVSEKQEETEDDCINSIMQTGLASSSEDTKYGEKGEYSSKNKGDSPYEGINCNSKQNYYEAIFCMLDEKKKEFLNIAENGGKISNVDIEVKEGYNSVKDKPGAGYVKARLDDIKRNISLLTKDEKEIVYITPSTTEEGLEELIKSGKADRTSARISEDEGITSMGNQSQMVAYCPIY